MRLKPHHPPHTPYGRRLPCASPPARTICSPLRVHKIGPIENSYIYIYMIDLLLSTNVTNAYVAAQIRVAVVSEQCLGFQRCFKLCHQSEP